MLMLSGPARLESSTVFVLCCCVIVFINFGIKSKNFRVQFIPKIIKQNFV